jgi:hypothetical protein
MAMLVTWALALALVQPLASDPMTDDEAVSPERIAEVRRIFREYWLGRSVDRQVGRPGALAHGAFYNDPNRCIAAFSSRYEAVEIDSYFVETVYAGAAVGYYFYPFNQIDSFFDEGERILPVAQSFSCLRHADWGDVLHVEPME